ncbi:undecaprenyldiphospho-muramoylpentapeptide beta-N-acetylglucosaminyltransferase [Amphibacillus sp. MSJ-3]|uniref:undecaprenyldiphospho-muramoylpentapeptide beta-N-acetylglucosaminyltransferase n=1 Tax=Amphibacillus sp. MSJ-3 TaxID=2841505 RepID=UPI001C0F07CA|nr:undecaprenyldiphospho-muramoylpentapeptide beta-N-acetylglucosaminyltransferase [Amphibacillus sp. MSJ-3]MBU5595670.1 undecaprenyldiphospho-muramoylpentapeptide beta-N-acetylglucosaminyltransferase [Amphibacillus sp. MSJ-3]
MKNKQIVLTGGGTAGHVMVNLAIIPILKQAGWSIDYIGSKQGIERELIEQVNDVTYHPISTGKLRRYLSIENIKDPFKVLNGIIQTLSILRKCKPQVIFSKGGFVSVPVLIAARLRGIPAVIHESDITPGLANKIAVPFAKKVLTTFPETLEYLPEEKASWIGAVVRPELFEGDRKSGLRFANLTERKPVIMIMGGSAGAQRINQAVRDQLDQLTQTHQIIHICGKGNLDPTIKKFGYQQFEYVNEELPDLLAATDLVISRAGANAIFEFLALNKPMLLIPLSRQASRGDQILNAEAFEKQGYAHVLFEEDLSADHFLEKVNDLIESADEMKENMANYKRQDATECVIEEIYKLAD